MKLLFKVSKHNAFRLMQKCIIHMRSPIIITIDFIVRVLYTFIVAINFAQNNDLHTWNFLTFAQWWPETSKVGFFSESTLRFSNIQNKHSKSVSWAWNLNSSLLLWTGNSNFMFRIVIWNISFFGDLKITSYFLKKSHL